MTGVLPSLSNSWIVISIQPLTLLYPYHRLLLAGSCTQLMTVKYTNEFDGAKSRAKALPVTIMDYLRPGGANRKVWFEVICWSSRLLQMLLCQTLRASGLNLTMLFSGGPLIAAFLEVHCIYNLLSNCSYTPIISRVTVVMGLIFRL